MMFPAMLLGPSVVGIVLTGVADGTSGLRDIFPRMCRVRVTAAQESLWYAVYAAAPWLVVAIIGMTNGNRLSRQELDYSGKGPGCNRATRPVRSGAT